MGLDKIREGFASALKRGENLPTEIVVEMLCGVLRDQEPVHDSSIVDVLKVGWLRAIDEEMVATHLGVAEPGESYEDAKRKLNALIAWHVAVATDPALNLEDKAVQKRLAAQWGYAPVTEAPSVPDPITPEQAPEGVQDYCYEAAEGYADGWNACIKAMLAAAPKPEGE